MPSPRLDTTRRRRHHEAEQRGRGRADLEAQLARVRRLRIVGKLAATVALALLYPLAVEWSEHCDDHAWPLVTGRIESTASVSRYLISRPELAIRIEPGDEMVRARLSANTRESFPDTVQFHYSGDPSREVRLIGETGLVWLMIFSLSGALLCWFLPDYGTRRLQQQLAKIDAEAAASLASVPRVE